MFPEWKTKSEVIFGVLEKGECTELILVPQNNDWAQMIENCYGEKAEKLFAMQLKRTRDFRSCQASKGGKQLVCGIRNETDRQRAF